MKKLLLALAAGATLAGSVVTPAAAQRYRHDYGYDDHGYRDRGPDYRGSRYGDGYRDGYDRRPVRHYRGGRCDGSTGTIVGAVAGALLGGEIGRGGYYNRRSGTGTIIGAGAGALLGRSVDQNSCRDNRYYRR